MYLPKTYNGYLRALEPTINTDTYTGEEHTNKCSRIPPRVIPPRVGETLTGFRVPSFRQIRSGGIPIRSHFPTSAWVQIIQHSHQFD